MKAASIFAKPYIVLRTSEIFEDIESMPLQIYLLGFGAIFPKQVFKPFLNFFRSSQIVRNRMKTRDFKLYIIKALGVASLMASGAVFLVLAATFTSSRTQQNPSGQWGFVVNIDQYFPTYNKWLWRISHNDEKDVSQCYLQPRYPGYIPVYHVYRPTVQLGGWQPWVQGNDTQHLTLLAAEAAPNLHTASVIEQTKYEISH